MFQTALRFALQDCDNLASIFLQINNVRKLEMKSTAIIPSPESCLPMKEQIAAEKVKID